MNLCVDASTVYHPKRRGTGKNLIDLYRNLAQIRPAWRVVMLHRGIGDDDPFADLPNVENLASDMKGDRWNLWREIRLPLEAARAGADVLHCPANDAPWCPLSPIVMTIHDLVPLDGRKDPQARRWLARLARSARRARRIITPSEYTRQRLIQTLRIPADKIKVNHWAPDQRCRRVTDPEVLAGVRVKYGLEAERPYVFGFGAADPRKNAEGILRAWAILPAEVRSACQLLLVGIQDRAMAPLADLVRRLEIDDGCVLSGFAAEEDIPALLSGAAVLCYPSLSEGFGLPVLDAFICRAAVLTSSTTSLPEVAGEAAVLVDPRDVAEISEGLRRLLTDEGLREGLVARGAQRVAGFTWRRCAERACDVFEDALAEVG